MQEPSKSDVALSAVTHSKVHEILRALSNAELIEYYTQNLCGSIDSQSIESLRQVKELVDSALGNLNKIARTYEILLKGAESS